MFIWMVRRELYGIIGACGFSVDSVNLCFVKGGTQYRFDFWASSPRVKSLIGSVLQLLTRFSETGSETDALQSNPTKYYARNPHTLELKNF
jgi:hypothetical protein